MPVHSAHATAPPGGGAPYVFARAPLLIYWELTRACDLSCRHCRAEAISGRHPRELSTAEGSAMLRDAVGFGPPLPHLVFTGGDPLKRPDLWPLIEAAKGLGFALSLAPSGTALLTEDAIRRLAAAGIESMSLSFDGSTPARHDAFRGVEGCFETTLQAARWIRAAGIPLQVNTLVTEETLPDLPAIYDRMAQLDIMRWSLFLLISVGRGRVLREITPEQAEGLFHRLLDLGRQPPFPIKTTEAPHFRRIAYTRLRRAGMDDAAIARTPVGRGFGIRDGNGIMFVAHTGEVYPSGFLPVVAGNARAASIVDIYRSSEVFVRLRDRAQLSGKCGACSFASICGGSRARAYAWTGDYMASDPLCPYQPAPRAAVGARTGV